VTAAFTDPGNSLIKSPYPKGIPIGTVTNFDYNTLVNNQTVNVSPDVNPRNISQVEVLTQVKN
jgi:cell shape-determining protein MreC